jgi:hypothetical protein
MLNKNIENGLSRGLISGYAGQTKFSAIERGGFSFKSSHLETDEIKYHDEWLDATVGGGQELIEVSGQQYTRLYAGGIIQKKLTELNITEKEIINFLKTCVITLKEKTRLFEECKISDQNNWSYSYQILDHEQNLPITTAKEIISYNNTVVFVHNFLLCPIKK